MSGCRVIPAMILCFFPNFHGSVCITHFEGSKAICGIVKKNNRCNPPKKKKSHRRCMMRDKIARKHVFLSGCIILCTSDLNNFFFVIDRTYNQLFNERLNVSIGRQTPFQTTAQKHQKWQSTLTIWWSKTAASYPT